MKWILALLVLWAVSVFAAFIAGRAGGRKAAEKEALEKKAREAREAAEYEAEKEKIYGEIFGNAEREKAGMGGGGAAERFDRIDGILRR
jgi:hypothetical protein